MRKSHDRVFVRAGSIEFVKINTGQREWRDAYHWVLSLTWPRFALVLLASYLAINCLFAFLYAIVPNCIGEMPSGSFSAAFFFSIETLATVGYGHMYPATLYGHVLTATEIIIGMFWIAVITGLIFVRFSRPTARISFSNNAVIANFNGEPHLMIRVANLRHTNMVEAQFRIICARNEETLEGDSVRRFYPLKLDPDHMIMFPAALTLRHRIDGQSPFHGFTLESLEKTDIRLMVSIVCIETVIPASVQSQHDYSWRDIRLDERFVEIYTEDERGRLVVDYARLHETEPQPSAR